MNKRERLWSRYWAIRDNHHPGHCTPILWHLAMGGDTMAMVELSSTFSRPGRIFERFTQAGLAFRAFRRGDATGAQHLAMNAFNIGDLGQYRHWLGKAARLGDNDAARELRRFEIRLPHEDAALIGRKRPYKSFDFPEAE
ncbi:hypothetical protein EUV02_15510 [Polymorphobacter arshaanensis]|uniref:Sel1 repeat family protein n=1 Tax=Glacieibacterium arshaanense TaxID=2511025 RepID=A0A4Y9EJW4_9SPHN|nr:hypothetical protein [Polymorphobacter arshaanensis]TFU00053.1 hypothetical protein EUV02_15510 [Polymorphobacter arshaanensis]